MAIHLAFIDNGKEFTEHLFDLQKCSAAENMNLRVYIQQRLVYKYQFSLPRYLLK